MADLIARSLACLCSLLLPARGKHRATPAFRPGAAPATCSWSVHSLPEHKSPYAREVAERRPVLDTIGSVRPYVLAEPGKRPDDPKRRAQAERRWALEMSERGIDVGPSVIHGVHVSAGTRPVPMGVGAS
ncbi:hypothetical protein [Streptomyces monashensis]|uniref:Uncharacterized protein n=1 Tax=Streptomyces monashensis TaxID=1678012 RepID=A0A1S2QF09_9ACTN|nr:hypothetical protein [Streptomyces monashensis]OIK03945.1 hypothetical protein BIV23_19010 [Streptomyces monashensis]